MKSIIDFNYVDRGRFHVFCTTKRLLRTATILSKHLCCDATYNITIQGFPILMCGSTDKDQQFHPFCLVISKFEDSQDYSYMFKTLKDLVLEVFDYVYDPTILVADSAHSITHGFESVYPLLKRVVCWVHMIRAIDHHLKTVDETYKGY